MKTAGVLLVLSAVLSAAQKPRAQRELKDGGKTSEQDTFPSNGKIFTFSLKYRLELWI